MVKSHYSAGKMKAKEINEKEKKTNTPTYLNYQLMKYRSGLTRLHAPQYAIDY